jgi:hypothetical protein
MYLVPSHVWDLDTAAVKPTYYSGYQPETDDVVLFRVLEQELHPQANTEERDP